MRAPRFPSAVAMVALAVSAAACTERPAKAPAGAYLDDGPLVARLEPAKGSVPVIEAIGMADAQFVCVIDSSGTVADANEELKETYGVSLPAGTEPNSAGGLLYVVTPTGPRYIRLSQANINPFAGCEDRNGLFHWDGQGWTLEPTPDPNRGSEEGRRLLAFLAKATTPVNAGDALGVANLEFVCLQPGASPQKHHEMIRVLYGEALPPPKAPPPGLKWLEHDIYVRAGGGQEKHIVFAGREGLSPDGEYCVRGDEAIFHKRSGEWRLDKRENLELDRRLAAERVAPAK